MPELKEGGSKEFVEFIRSNRSAEEVASGKYAIIKGSAYRIGDSTFALTSVDGYVIEMETSAVERFRVVGTGLCPEVELLVSAEALKNAKMVASKSITADVSATHAAADLKLVTKDIRTDPITDQTHFAMDHKIYQKEVAKDPVFDPVGTLVQDQIGGTLAETAAEGITFDPSQVQINPATMQAASAATPFVMATPHHAPSPLVNLQAGAAQTQATAALKPLQSDTLKEVTADNTLKELINDTHKELTQDTLKELIMDTRKEMIQDTHKEMVADTYKEMVADTHKEVIETIVEGGGTIQEGGGQGTLAEGGQNPGGFPGMPGF